ncbi:MAG: inositol monophosphatase family protein [Alphaproteobacteria bacterium]
MTLLSDSQRDAVYDTIIAAAESAVLPRFQNLAEGEISAKSSPSDLVTIADREAEALLTDSLTKILPGSVVVGEESVSANPDVLRAIDGDAPVWIVDPVDGTRNFANGQTPFCVMVALAVRGITVGAWIWRPIDSEMVVAFRDEGVRLFETNTGNSRSLQVARPLAVTEMNGFVSFRYLSEEHRTLARKNAKKMRRIQAIGCAGEEYLRIAEGRDHFAVFGSLHPWDHAPGSLIVEEAGGLAVIGGEAYRPTNRVGPLWIASSGHVFETARTRLFEA